MQVETGSARQMVRDRVRIRSWFGSMARVGANDDDDPIPPSSALDPALRARLKREPWEATTPFVLDWGRMRGRKPKKVRAYLDQAWLELRTKKYPWDTKKQALVEHHVCGTIARAPQSAAQHSPTSASLGSIGFMRAPSLPDACVKY